MIQLLPNMGTLGHRSKISVPPGLDVAQISQNLRQTGLKNPNFGQGSLRSPLKNPNFAQGFGHFRSLKNPNFCYTPPLFRHVAGGWLRSLSGVVTAGGIQVELPGLNTKGALIDTWLQSTWIGYGRDICTRPGQQLHTCFTILFKCCIIYIIFIASSVTKEVVEN